MSTYYSEQDNGKRIDALEEAANLEAANLEAANLETVLNLSQISEDTNIHTTYDLLSFDSLYAECTIDGRFFSISVKTERLSLAQKILVGSYYNPETGEAGSVEIATKDGINTWFPVTINATANMGPCALTYLSGFGAPS